VATHALMDALLGAAGLGDIGALFPDSDPAYAAADSVGLLADVSARVRAAGWSIANVDVVIVCEAPRVAPYRTQMIVRLASGLGIDATSVSVKGSTSEGMGFEGRREGISATAVCLLERAG
jgi:2-C-methyl-D-erythritol 2,4-cyclodiphosphate synthase